MKTGFGLLMIFMGAALMSLSRMFGGTQFQEFLLGLLQGVALASVLLGTYAVLRGIASAITGRRKRRSY